MSSEIEISPLIPDHVDRKRKIRQHIGQDHRDGAERAGERKIIQRFDTGE
jgi:hypothetical protein